MRNQLNLPHGTKEPDMLSGKQPKGPLSQSGRERVWVCGVKDL